jgi:hypothetical protein
MSDRAELRRAFAEQIEFADSPLYCELSQVVAEHEWLLDLAGRGRPGQYPPFLSFGAVHELLDGFTRTVAVVNGHLRWIETLPG